MVYKLALTELYWDYHHGKTVCTSKNIEGQHMVVYDIELNEFYGKEYLLYKEIVANSQKDSIEVWDEKYFSDIKHPIRNFKNIFGKRNELEIVKIQQLDGLEEVAIIKTVWFKLLQRKIKKWLKNKNKNKNMQN